MNNSLIKEIADFVLSNCNVMHVEFELLIFCKDEDDYAFLIRHNKNLQQSLSFIAPKFTSKISIEKIEKITLVIAKSQIKFSFPTNKMPSSDTKIILSSPSQDELITECLSYGGACGIVRMSDHKGLFSNEKIIISIDTPTP